MSRSSGEQAFNTYGPKPNEELLLGYGFVSHRNPADIVALKLPPPPDGLRKQIWELAGLVKHDGGRVFVGRDGELSPTLVRQVRTMLLSQDEARAVLNTGNEKAACEKLDDQDYKDEMDTLMTLGLMVQRKEPSVVPQRMRDMLKQEGVRPEVAKMISTYRKGEPSLSTRTLIGASEHHGTHRSPGSN
jgi:hypothetical protein